ncbi:hypothetical protein Pmani_028341 [Petrolisthes manimaculis]|uniref:Uncharacterized protein n=1 Tax=Petrolisthes manimaculis TaxID=1843537 RepID=A0AAE1P2B4_9EUCA|nr:hypothetical protein Pmani_028341 [Petrolisthes manimaculis]
MGIGVTIEAILLLLAPTWAANLGLMPFTDVTIPSRLAGAALAGLCVFVWSLLGTSDKHYARTMLLSMLTYHTLSICVSAASVLSFKDENNAEADSTLNGNEHQQHHHHDDEDNNNNNDDEDGGGGDDDEVLDMFEARATLLIGVRATMCLLCLVYFYSIGEPTFGIRKSTSYKDLAKDEAKKDN